MMAVGLVFTACGAAGAYGSASTTSSTGTASPTPGSSVVVKTGTATVNGRSETVLTDADGNTLYYFTPDASGKVTCTGSCASIWPPLQLAAWITSPTASTTLPGSLGTIAGAGGTTQVTYQKWPLYTYANDTAAGQAKGEGLQGKWFVATPSLKPPSTSTSGSSSTSSGY